MSLFHATLYRRRITDITLDDLSVLGVRGLLLDVDNTLTEHGSQYLADDVRQWLETMKQAGIALTVVSNSWEWRVAPFAEKIGLRHTSLSLKPSPLGFWRGIRRLGLKKHEVAAVGDQLFTDIVGANLAGVKCIRLEPIKPEENHPLVQFKRRCERFVDRHRKD